MGIKGLNSKISDMSTLVTEPKARFVSDGTIMCNAACFLSTPINRLSGHEFKELRTKFRFFCLMLIGWGFTKIHFYTDGKGPTKPDRDQSKENVGNGTNESRNHNKIIYQNVRIRAIEPILLLEASKLGPEFKVTISFQRAALEADDEVVFQAQQLPVNNTRYIFGDADTILYKFSGEMILFFYSPKLRKIVWIDRNAVLKSLFPIIFEKNEMKDEMYPPAIASLLKNDYNDAQDLFQFYELSEEVRSSEIQQQFHKTKTATDISFDIYSLKAREEVDKPENMKDFMDYKYPEQRIQKHQHNSELDTTDKIICEWYGKFEKYLESEEKSCDPDKILENRKRWVESNFNLNDKTKYKYFQTCVNLWYSTTKTQEEKDEKNFFSFDPGSITLKKISTKKDFERIRYFRKRLYLIWEFIRWVGLDWPFDENEGISWVSPDNPFDEKEGIIMILEKKASHWYGRIKYSGSRSWLSLFLKRNYNFLKVGDKVGFEIGKNTKGQQIAILKWSADGFYRYLEDIQKSVDSNKGTNRRQYSVDNKYHSRYAKQPNSERSSQRSTDNTGCWRQSKKTLY